MRSEIKLAVLKGKYCIVFAWAILTTSNCMLAADLEKGKLLFATCAGCHGPQAEGNAILKAPQLAGISEWYGADQMEKFKSGLRGTHKDDITGAMMRPMAFILPTLEDVQTLMAYLASLETNVPEKTIEGDIAKGKALFQTCAHCHGIEGNGNEEFHAPSLLRLSDWYMLEQLKKFKKKVRGEFAEDFAGSTMQAMTISLTDEQAMKDVIAYILTLSGK